MGSLSQLPIFCLARYLSVFTVFLFVIYRKRLLIQAIYFFATLILN